MTGNTPVVIQCKVIENSDVFPSSSRQWTRAEKCKLEFTEDALHFKTSVIRYEDIEDAKIHIYQSALLFEYGVFSLTSGGKTLYFGIKYDTLWKDELPFAVERIHVETPFLQIRKAVLFVMVLYVIWELIKQ